jgi:hypothetical protein
MKKPFALLSMLFLLLSVNLNYAQVTSPTNLNAFLFENMSIKISWADTSSTKTGFVLESSIGSTERWSVLDTLSTNANQYILTPIMDGSVYYFRVSTLYDSTKSYYSNIVSVDVPLFAPTELSSSLQDLLQIDLRWIDNSSNEAGYKIERKVGTKGLWSLIANLPPNTSSFSDSELRDGEHYYYRTCAFSSDTSSQLSNETNLFIPISAPNNLKLLVIANDKINLSWADNSKGETNYILQQKIGNSGNYNPIAELGPNSITYTVENLIPDSTFYFRTYCYNPVDTSDFSNEIKYTVPAIAVIPETTESASPFSFNMELNLGITMTARSTRNIDKENLEWLLGTHLYFSYLGESFQFDMDLFLQYGQLVAKRILPEKTQDNIILNLMPSIKLISSPTIRLFLQTKAESQVSKGFIDDQETKFADPMFLTHTLFLGNKNQIITLLEDLRFKAVYGLGYSFQQIIKKNFQLISEIQSSSEVEYLDGPSAVFNILFTKSFGESVSSSISISTLLMARKDFFNEVKNSRFSSLLVASLSIDLFTIKYTNRLIYDSDISSKRQLVQSLVLSLQLNL